MRVRGRCRVCQRGYDLPPGRTNPGTCGRGRCRRRNPITPTRHHTTAASNYGIEDWA